MKNIFKYMYFFICIFNAPLLGIIIQNPTDFNAKLSGKVGGRCWHTFTVPAHQSIKLEAMVPCNNAQHPANPRPVSEWLIDVRSNEEYTRGFIRLYKEEAEYGLRGKLIRIKQDYYEISQ